MKTPHKHAELIKQWADGAEIECRKPTSIYSYHREWFTAKTPSWADDWEYRVKPQPHKWQKEMDAAKAGKIIEWRSSHSSKWMIWAAAAKHVENPGSMWHQPVEFTEIRIKPEPVIQDACLRWNNSSPTPIINLEVGDNYKHLNNVRFTFEEGVLVKAEVLK